MQRLKGILFYVIAKTVKIDLIKDKLTKIQNQICVDLIISKPSFIFHNRKVIG